MSSDAKLFAFLISSALIAICAVTVGVGWSNYLFTIRQKDCISAGYEWVHLPNFTEMECRKASK